MCPIANRQAIFESLEETLLNKKVLALTLSLFMAFSSFSLAAAEGELLPCEGDEIIGSIMSIDEETGQVVIKTETGECYVTLDQEYDQPIVDLFNDYFGTVDYDELADAAANLDGWATYDEATTTWTWSSDETVGATAAKLLSLTDNLDGTYTLEYSVEGELLPVYVILTDPVEIAYYMALLDAAIVEFSLTQDEEGNSFISDVGDEVMAYHEDGMGFGVLIKFYSLAAETDLTVEELVAMFKDGKTGLGLIFRDYGTPSMMGIGHLKQELKADSEASSDPELAGATDTKGKSDNPNKGGKSEDKGNKGKGKGKN
jgi:hypothetical protein